jgi:predicted homoserine dehydrogenase-like protein
MIRHELLKREAEGNPIRVGASAVAWMGGGFVEAMQGVPGMELSLIANPDPGEAIAMFEASGVPQDAIVETHDPGRAQDAIRAGKRVVSGSYLLPAQVDALDIVTDCTWSPAIGAEVAFYAIEHGKNVVLINIEADVTVGRQLNQLARQAGVLYSVSSGDEPGCLIELYDFVTSLGYEVIAIGKGKNNPLNPSATPDDVAESAAKADKDPVQVASYVDGTKTMFEMTCAANATGCVPIRRGMTGPPAEDLDTVSKLFALEEDGGTSPHPGIVDFVQGKGLAGGVFVTVRVGSKRIQDDLNYLKVGRGEYFTFFRPYHLWFLEAPLSIARAHLYGEQWLAPLDTPIAENIAVAKRDLSPGEVLDDFGGYTTYGIMEKSEVAYQLNALPTGLTPGAKIIRAVTKGSILTWDDVQLDESSRVVKLRRMQDQHS